MKSSRASFAAILMFSCVTAFAGDESVAEKMKPVPLCEEVRKMDGYYHWYGPTVGTLCREDGFKVANLLLQNKFLQKALSWDGKGEDASFTIRDAEYAVVANGAESRAARFELEDSDLINGCLYEPLENPDPNGIHACLTGYGPKEITTINLYVSGMGGYRARTLIIERMQVTGVMDGILYKTSACFVDTAGSGDYTKMDGAVLEPICVTEK